MQITSTKKGLGIVICLLVIAAPLSRAFASDAAVGLGSAKLKTSQVCMMNNKYFETEQIPVSVNGKNYYGCCAGCAASLQNNPQIRQATDPYSGEAVDKADAFIVLKSDATKEVQYFKSEQNYQEYQKLSSTPNMSRANG